MACWWQGVERDIITITTSSVERCSGGTVQCQYTRQWSTSAWNACSVRGRGRQDLGFNVQDSQRMRRGNRHQRGGDPESGYAAWVAGTDDVRLLHWMCVSRGLDAGGSNTEMVSRLNG